MDNRPHSRKERVSNQKVSAQKQSFNNTSNRGSSSNRSSGVGGIIGAAVVASILNKQKQQHGQSQQQNNSQGLNGNPFIQNQYNQNQQNSYYQNNNQGLNGNPFSNNQYQNPNVNNNIYGNNNYNNSNNKSSGLSRIIKIIAIVIIVIFILRLISSFSSNFSDIDFNDPTNVNTNPFIQNTTNNSYNLDTSTQEPDLTVADGARDKYTKILGNKNDEVTVMIYMIGTDLESNYGAATADINEMVRAELNDNINIVIQTGGCSKWNNSVISNKTIQRYTLNSAGFHILQDNVGSFSMVNPDTLSSFIKYGASNFPANRYMLVLWDHGGGSVAGYGMDEKYRQDGSMSPDEIAMALKNGGVKFDFVGFDACLMANLETAIAIEPYADYLIGSEETEPGGGWHYTQWLTKLDDNTSIETVKLAKVIIDDYITSSANSTYSPELTQSITDLGELVYNVKSPLVTFSKAVKDKLEGDDYQEIANARSKTKEFSRSAHLDQVDLIDLCEKFNVEGSDELVKAIKKAVKYNRTDNIANAYGLSAYFPYSSLSKMNQMVEIYENINMDESYTSIVKSFASYASSGQVATQSSGSSATSLFDILAGNSYSGSSYSSDDLYSLLSGAFGGYGSSSTSYDSIFGSGYDSWFNYDSLGSIADYLGRSNLVDDSMLEVKKKNGQNVVSLTEEQWSLIDNVQLNMFVDDGRGYIDLGRDNLFSFNDEGDLIVESDGTWLTLNNHLVAYYMVDDQYINDDNYKTVGRIPAYLNNERVDIIVNFTNENPYGIILGASRNYDDTDVKQKGLIEIKKSDVIKFVANYYSYDGKFISEYQLGDTYIVNDELELWNAELIDNYIYSYCFEDIYKNKLWTPCIKVR